MDQVTADARPESWRRLDFRRRNIDDRIHRIDDNPDYVTRVLVHDLHDNDASPLGDLSGSATKTHRKIDDRNNRQAVKIVFQVYIGAGRSTGGSR